MSELQRYISQNGIPTNPAKVMARADIITYMTQARLDNKTYLALTAPTAAEQKNQINKLTRQNTKIMRMLMNDIEGVD